MKRRIEYLDVAKGIGILLMIAGHIYANTWFQIVVYSFHMPLFLLISGILLNETGVIQKPLPKVVFLKFKRLIIPYFATEFRVLPLFYLKTDILWRIGLGLLLTAYCFIIIVVLPHGFC